MENFLNLLFIPKCFLCGAIGDVICEECLSSANMLHRRFSLGDSCSVFCLFEYKGCVSKCIRYSKYASRMFSALRRLTTWGLDQGLIPDYKGYVVVPIPLASGRLNTRGFNQSKVIASVLAKKTSLDIQEGFLMRIKETLPQYSLGRNERLKNMSSAFKVRRNVMGKKVLLVDDICTSGSTFISASKELYKAGAANVECLALSKKL